MTGRALCPVCEKRVKAGKDSQPKRHRRDRVEGVTVWVEPCAGSPKEETDRE